MNYRFFFLLLISDFHPRIPIREARTGTSKNSNYGCQGLYLTKKKKKKLGSDWAIIDEII